MKKEQIIKNSCPNLIFHSFRHHFAYKIKISITTKLNKMCWEAKTHGLWCHINLCFNSVLLLISYVISNNLSVS